MSRSTAITSQLLGQPHDRWTGIFYWQVPT
jgi:hypothetical protein